jgi:hypothetical protein
MSLLPIDPEARWKGEELRSFDRRWSPARRHEQGIYPYALSYRRLA